jgi:hypothetical protein
MAWLDIRVDEIQLAEIRQAVAGVRQGLGRVVIRALNKVAFATRTRIVNRYVAQTGVKRGFVLKCVRVGKASLTRWAAKVNIRDRGAPLIWFAARQSGKGVTFRAPPGADWATDFQKSKKGRLFVPHAFIQTMPRSGHKGVFLRSDTKRMRGRPNRAAIDELFGGSVFDLFGNVTQETAALVAETQTMLHQELDVQVGVLLDQQARGRVMPLSPRVAALTGATTGRLVA